MSDPNLPLGKYQQLAHWSEHSRSWGPEDAWTASFGGGVVADLVEGINSFPALMNSRYPAKAEPFSVAVGCVPWLTSFEVVDALVGLTSVCIAIDKSNAKSEAVGRLQEEASPVWQPRLPGLEWMAPLDPGGRQPVIGPGFNPGERDIGPVRVVGWQKVPRSSTRPILHAKILVLCAAWRWEGELGEELERLTPLRVWVGSANWTFASKSHLEFGAWCDDAGLAEEALAFVSDVLKFSEPYGAATNGPEPELVVSEWDDDAFAEYMAEYRVDHVNEDE